MGYYPNSIARLREIIKKHFPNATAKEGLDDLPSHLLWMLQEIAGMKVNPKGNSRKAGRWIGYVIGRLESPELLTNEESRNMVRQDVQNGYDRD